MNYTYDDFERLTIAQAGAYTRSYSFDRWGNLKTVWGSGGEVPGYTLNYATNGSGAPATNQIVNINGTIPVTHDAAGNMTSEGSTSYSYDAASRLKEVGTGGQNVYGYDGDGRRVRQVASGGSPLVYVWSTVLGEVAYEANSTDSAVRAYLYAGKRQIALRGTDRGFYWVHSDHLGSLKKLTRTNGTVAYRVEYDPHGQRVMEWSDVSTSLSSHKFTGHEFDSSTGLEYAKARMLSHNRGRFMQPDPADLGASAPDRPQTLNLYSYVNNDGVNFVDRTGLFANPPKAGPTYEDDVFEDPTDIFRRPEAPGFEPGGGGGGGSRDIEKQWLRSMQCSKNGEHLISDMISNFGKYADYAGFAGPAVPGAFAAIKFRPGNIEVGRVIDIDHIVSMLIGAQDINVEITSKVKVVSITSNSITFEPVLGSHPLVGSITFAASNIGNGEIKFTVSVSADPANFGYSAFFKYLGGAEFEHAVWTNLLNNVQKECQR